MVFFLLRDKNLKFFSKKKKAQNVPHDSLTTKNLDKFKS